MLKIILLVLFFSSKIVHTTTTYYGKVVKIADGDSFEMLLENKTTLKIRMLGIDAPEKKQDYYALSKVKLSKYIFGKQIKVIVYSKDKYKRSIADVYINKQWINKEMILNGLAWHYKKYSKDTTLKNAEAYARKNKIGLWKMANPIAPWEFRK